ncbi:hypothetical protein ABZU08_00625 [Lactobacillus iners]|uniref:hypothetical protein n=1 Tax=Lactobacillus iners TaxID=147802 RepID=UPI001F09B865|nr:hypothetical protein [Lactobacillus iners]MCT7676234.1 hypothetical protein [Lactobacillus iners]MCT7756224.1 hypothetical protein [Lactobacillus iners]
MDYQEILEKIVNGELDEYKVEPQTAFAFQRVLRNFQRRSEIQGVAQVGGSIIYRLAK